MAALGKHQLEMLATMAGVHRAIVVPDKITRSLCRRGLMIGGSDKSDGFLLLTPAAYRTIAEALESGAIVRRPVDEWLKPDAAPRS